MFPDTKLIPKCKTDNGIAFHYNLGNPITVEFSNSIVGG